MAIDCRHDAAHFVENNLVMGAHESSHRSGGEETKASSSYEGGDNVNLAKKPGPQLKHITTSRVKF